MKKESQLGLENPKVVVVVGDGVEAVADMREREREREREGKYNVAVSFHTGSDYFEDQGPTCCWVSIEEDGRNFLFFLLKRKIYKMVYFFFSPYAGYAV